MPTTLTDDQGPKIISYTDLIANNLKLDKLQTQNGKQIKVDKNHRGYFEIAFASGGEKPKEFQGIFTTIEATTTAISNYLAKKEKPNAKTESSKAAD